MSLEGLFKARRQKGIIVPLLNAYLILKAQEPNNRETGVFHPSEISGFFCPRQWVIKERYRDSIIEEVDPPGLTRTYDIGSTLHELMQKYLAGMGILFGQHICKKCYTVYYGFKPTEKCSCGCNKFKYEEVKITDTAHHIGGHTDGIVVVDFNPDKMFLSHKYVFEFKSINPESYSNLRKPLSNHEDQACTYLYALEKEKSNRIKLLTDSGVKETDPVYLVESMPFEGVIIMYQNKGRQPADGMGDLKEYLVPAKGAREVVEKKIPLLDEAWKHFLGETLPKATCTCRTDGHKNGCPKSIMDYCFKLDS